MRPKSKSKSRGKAAPSTIDEYLAPLSSDQRAALQKLRKALRAVLPKGEEGISYGIPTLRLDGKPVVWFGAGANHCAFYPGAALEELAGELEGFETSKGTVRFQPDHPIPASLLRKLVKARLARTGASARKETKRSRRHS